MYGRNGEKGFHLTNRSIRGLETIKHALRSARPVSVSLFGFKNWFRSTRAHIFHYFFHLLKPLNRGNRSIYRIFLIRRTNIEKLIVIDLEQHCSLLFFWKFGYVLRSKARLGTPDIRFRSALLIKSITQRARWHSDTIGHPWKGWCSWLGTLWFALFCTPARVPYGGIHPPVNLSCLRVARLFTLLSIRVA